MFKNYSSKPIKRNACCIRVDGSLRKLPNMESTWQYDYMGQTVQFKAHQTPVVDDYIVYLNDDDVYHVDAKTFAERNITEGYCFDINTVAARKNFVECMKATAKFSYHQLQGTNYTICVATFADGWSQTGQSVCVDPNDFNQELGEHIARENALRDADTHYWRVAGYMAMIGMSEVTYEPK